MLSRAWYIDKKVMMSHEDKKYGERKKHRYLFTIKEVSCKDKIEVF